VVPRIGLDDGEDGRQRDRIEIVAETHRRDLIERDFDVVRGEIAQRGREQPDKPVEHDFEHRQTLVGHHRRIDDGANAGMLIERQLIEIEAQKAVDFLLVENAVGATARLVIDDAGAAVEHGRPFGGHLFGTVAAGALLRERCAPFGGYVDVFFLSHRSAYCSSNSLNRMASTLAGKTAWLMRRRSSSLSMYMPADPSRS